MCKTPTGTVSAIDGSSTTTTSTTKNILVAGAGPAGLLSAINLLRRNELQSNADGSPLYKVTLVDPSPENYGKLKPSDLVRHRSWMIGLSGHGLKAIRNIPGLFENYIGNAGTELQSVSFHMAKREFKIGIEDFGGEAYLVDRNYIVAGLARFIEDRYGDKKGKWLDTFYGTRVQFVDGERKRALVMPVDGSKGSSSSVAREEQKNNNGNYTDLSSSDTIGDPEGSENSERYISYDIMLGCDGVRSVARDAILHSHRDFAFDISEAFEQFKAVHINRPKSADPNTMHFMNNLLPHMTGIALPETGNKVNLAFGHFFHKPADDVMMHSTDVQEVAAYVKNHLVTFPLDDYEDFAKQWISQKWNTTGMAHCNFYHSNKVNILLMGDAAHATSPNIGQGMNTALEDAFVLNSLLNVYGDNNWKKVMEAFSDERVKEGNALTELSYLSLSFCEKQMRRRDLHDFLRMTLHKIVPWLVEEDPMAKIVRGEPLSEAYDAMCRLGTVPAVRKVNEGIRRDYFEAKTGMVKKVRKDRDVRWGAYAAFAVAAAAAVTAMRTKM